MKEKNIIKIYYNKKALLVIEENFDELTNMGQVLMELEILKLGLINKYAIKHNRI